jgi:hypothetical protein
MAEGALAPCVRGASRAPDCLLSRETVFLVVRPILSAHHLCSIPVPSEDRGRERVALVFYDGEDV